MGAWIEIASVNAESLICIGRTPRWVRGLKFAKSLDITLILFRRTPRWVRGLKFLRPLP